MLTSGLIYFSVGIGDETVKPGARTVRFLGARTNRRQAGRPPIPNSPRVVGRGDIFFAADRLHGGSAWGSAWHLLWVV
jgi:hypothetical protein